MMLKRYYSDSNDFESIHHKLKQTSCPKCKSFGTLILNGLLYGYINATHNVRGHKIICNKRRKSNVGCGHCYSILKTQLIKGISYTTKTLWNFVTAILNGSCHKDAIKNIETQISIQTASRLFKKIKKRQSIIRNYLFGLSPNINHIDSSEPLQQTMFHLQATFPNSLDPLAAFQQQFQYPVL